MPRARRCARWLGAHAVLIGAGWIPLVFAVFLVDPAAVQPRPLVGGVYTVGAVFAFPLLWPLWLAIAWREAALAERLAAGDTSAAMPARRGLIVLACMFAFVTLVVARFGVMAAGESDRQELAQWAWLGPFAVAALHAALAWNLRAGPDAGSTAAGSDRASA